MTVNFLAIAKQILSNWQNIRPINVSAVNVGNINKTFIVECEDGQAFILQCVNKIFSKEVNNDIDIVTQHLHNKGLMTTMLVETDGGDLYAMQQQNPWRLMTYIRGKYFEQVLNPPIAHQAGYLTGKFHVALANLRYAFKCKRTTFSTKEHLDKFAKILNTNKDHKYFADIATLSSNIFAYSQKLPNFTNLPKKNCHGDLKINNFIFSEDNQALSIVDLDTIGPNIFPLEFGNALRSWCNPLGEDNIYSNIELELVKSAVSGYGQSARHLWSKAEVDMLFDGLAVSTLELAVRFLCDVFEDNYFDWNRQRFNSRSHHNFIRGKGQLHLYEDIIAKKEQIGNIIALNFSAK